MLRVAANGALEVNMAAVAPGVAGRGVGGPRFCPKIDTISPGAMEV